MTTRLALLQMNSGIDPVANAEKLASAVKEAKRAGAQMLFTPEMSGLLDRDRARSAKKIANEELDRALSCVRTAAREHQIWVQLGSLAIRERGDDARFSNRSFVIDDEGKIRARYDKIHLFDVDIPTGETWRESSAFAPGRTASAIETPVGLLGLTVCYDLRFPALFCALSSAGATILSVPAAFTVPTGEAHWHCLLRARAIENACWVVAAAQTGKHEDGRETYGHSLVISPWGEILLDMGKEPGLATIDIDLAMLDQVRQRIPVIAHRRHIPEVQLLL
jgi:deaminated glutathione amidase